MRMAAATAALLLVSCGGGDSGVSITLSPSSLSATVQEGESQSFYVVGTVHGELTGNVFVGIVDPGHAIASPVAITQQSSTTYGGTIEIDRALTPGTHNSALQLLLCSDPACAQRIATASLPYSFTVVGNTNLTPLTPLAGAGNWTTVRGGPAHTGYVPVMLDPERFTSRWVKQLPHASDEVTPEISTLDGRAFVVNGTSTAHVFTIDALDEFDGSVTWSFNLGSQGAVSQPATSPTAIFVNGVKNSVDEGTGKQHHDATVFAIDPSNGSFLYSARVTAALIYTAHVGAPVFRSGRLFFSGGSPYGTTMLAAASGDLVWQSDVGGTGGSSVAVGDTLEYSPRGKRQGDIVEGGLASRSVVDGASGFDVSLPNGGWYDAVPVLAGSAVLVNTRSALASIDAASGQVLWTQSGTFDQDPAVAGGVVYIEHHEADALQARSLADGHLLWSWSSPDTEGFLSPPIVTDNLVFVATTQKTYAIDLATHQTVWSYPHAGPLAISGNGILYISRQMRPRFYGASSSEGYLTAINLH